METFSKPRLGRHDWLLSDAVDILPFLLLPLAGPEELSEEENNGKSVFVVSLSYCFILISGSSIFLLRMYCVFRLLVANSSMCLLDA